MKQKQIIQLAIVAIAVVFSFFTDWFNDKPQKNPPAKQAEKAQHKPQSKQSAVNSDYDFIMRNDAIGPNKQAKTDYYMLALSWSPAFCETQQYRNSGDLPASAQMQCGVEKKYGWVIHGLWPQSAVAKSSADHPRFCQGDLPAVDYQMMQPYLAESPSLHLLQGEWEKHGACAFDSAEQYFKKQQELYRTLTLPQTEMSKKELFRWVKAHNPQLKNAYLGASRAELFICYDLNWQVMDCK
ncbi:ribonuclease T2 family protein [Pasteurellaceae bacterium 22721_9_1]